MVELPWFPSLRCISSFTAWLWLLHAVEDPPFFCCPLGCPSPMPRSVHHSGNGLAVWLEFQVWRTSLPLLVCLPGTPFLFGCPGFVLTEEKSTGNKVEMFRCEKEYGSSLARLVFCLAFVKRIPRCSLENLKPALQQTGGGRG